MSAPLCPCGTGQPFAGCCQPRHDGTRPAVTAEALMRSRYSAYVTGNGAYLVATSAAGGDPDELSRWGQSVTWLGLEIRERERGAAADPEGAVVFAARYLERGAEWTLTEHSRFDRVGGRWRYLDGVGERTSRPVERNEKCPCGSGKKFKSCHG